MDNDLDLVVEVVSAYAQKNKMSQSELIELIRAVHGLFVELDGKAPTPQNSAKDDDLTGTSFFHGMYREA